MNTASTVTFSSYTSSPANLAGCGPFQGMAKHTSAFMAGERGCYWFSVGAPSGYLSGNPAYNTGTGVASATAAQRTKLWVR